MNTETTILSDLVTIIEPIYHRIVFSNNVDPVEVLAYFNVRSKCNDCDYAYLKVVRIRKSFLTNKEEFFLKPSDIVLSVKGCHIGTVTIVPSQIPDMKWIISGGCVALRIKNDSTDPQELFDYLKSEKAQMDLQALIRGKQAGYISIEDLVNMRIMAC